MKCFLLFFSFILFASKTYAVDYAFDAVVNKRAPVFRQIGTKPVMYLEKGRRVKVYYEKRNNFYRLVTKSNRPLFIRDIDVGEEGGIADDLYTGPPEENQAPPPQQPGRITFPHFTYDLGVASGCANDECYTEANLGLNTFFNKHIAWRNAGFYRFVEPEDIYGLDTSGRLYGYFGGEPPILTAFAGPGYRFSNDGNSAPFAEGGVIARLAGFTLGAGVKQIFLSAVADDGEEIEDETLVFIILSGSGAF